MSTVSAIQGSRTALTVTGLATLAAANYVASSAYDCAANDPLEVLVEVALATTNTPGGNKKADVFVQASLDGTNFSSGPTSGSTTTDEPDLHYIGTVPINTVTTTHRKVFPVSPAFGGVLPAQFKVVIHNDLGAALTSGTVYTAEVLGNVA
jgi:hypothetical protein